MDPLAPRYLPGLIALLLSIWTAVSTAGVAETDAAPDRRAIETADPLSALDTLVPKRLEATKIPGAAIAFVDSDGRISVRTYGESAPGVALEEDDLFNVASLTKPVFAALVLHLVNDGALELDTRLADHWVDPDVADDPRHVSLTPRLTLSHQSGLPNWRRETMSFQFAPGARHEYSGEGYEYTRRALEAATERKLTELMKAHVLEPAGMRESHFGHSDTVAASLVTGFDEAREPLDGGHLATRRPNAAANLFTTARDYARFARWIARGAGLPEPLFAAMTSPHSQHADPAESWGLGWRLIPLGQGDGSGSTSVALSHDGREQGVRTQVFVDPTTREALVILTNSSHGELLVAPVTEAVLANGSDIMRHTALEIWRFLESAPQEQFPNMVRGISRSPSFVAKLLHAVHAALVVPSGLSADDLDRARAAIDPFVLDMVEGTVTHEQAATLFGHLILDAETSPRLRERFDANEAGAWLEALSARSESRS